MASSQEAASSQESNFKVNTDFNFQEFLKDVIGPLDENETDCKKKEDDRGKAILWNACILWDDQVLEEFKDHDDFQRKLHTTLYFGRLMSEKLQASDNLAEGDFPSIATMKWEKEFIMVDIVTEHFGTCGVNRSLRVQQTATYDSPKIQDKPPMWDLVIYKECESLGNEMVRRFKNGIKTTLVIWGAYLSIYDKPWINCGHHVKGEIFLKPAKKNADTLSVLIFHQEKITTERRQKILGADKDSELWNDFQESKQEYSWFAFSNKKENQVAFHVMKKFKNGGGEDEEKDSKDSSSVEDLDFNLLHNLKQLFEEIDY